MLWPFPTVYNYELGLLNLAETMYIKRNFYSFGLRYLVLKSSVIELDTDALGNTANIIIPFAEVKQLFFM